MYYYKHLAHHARDNIDENTSPSQKRTINTLKTLACMYSDLYINFTKYLANSELSLILYPLYEIFYSP